MVVYIMRRNAIVCVNSWPDTGMIGGILRQPDFNLLNSLNMTPRKTLRLLRFAICSATRSLAAACAASVWFFSASVNAAEFKTLAFGSCNHGHLPQPMWSVIESHEPDLFLWTGDVVYADTTDPVKMKRKYSQQLNRPEYRQFTSKIPVIGVWDDHDYGINNGGKKHPTKARAQQMFLDFIGEPQGTDRRKQEGVYTSYTYGEGQNTVKLFLLDVRYNRDLTGSGRADTLGEKQWRWLEKEIKNSTASVNIIVSSISVLSTQFPFAEEWSDFKWSRKRLFKLLDDNDLPGVLFLTGDRHFSSHYEGKVKGQVYHEFMSSGLTHYMNRPWVSAIFKIAYGETDNYFNRNFSKITFHWDRQPLQMTFEVFGTKNKQRVEKSLSLVDGFWSDKLPLAAR